MDIIMPQLGETVLEGTVSVWYKKPGDAVAADESLFEVETEKVTTEIPSPVAGIVREILVPVGTTVKVGTRLAVVETTGGGAARPATAAPAAASPPAPVAGAAPAAAAAAPAPLPRSAAAKLSPVVRRLLGESGLRPEQVRGTGRDGRITREDVLGAMAAGGNTAAAAPESRAPAAASAPAPAPLAGPDDRVVPLNKVRRATAAHMVRSVATSPHTLQAIEVDFHRVEQARRARGASWKEQEGFALSYLPFVCAAVCEALAEFPYVNASFGNDELIVHRRIHLGIAVDLGFEGLLAPVLRDANRRNLRGLAVEIAALVARTRAGTVAADDLKGGTYTISNSGSFGTLITAPIINQPQAAILSTDGVHKKPVVIEGPDGDVIAIRPIGILAQSFDHRAFDGAYSAAFLRRLKQGLEERDWLAELN
jgi:2-oxoglutarate dehydrogenase E2 component (dihydrolipoamide succinyltransferase)